MTSKSSRRVVTVAAVALWLTAPGVAEQVPQGRLEDQVVPNVGTEDIQVLPVRENVFMVVGAGANITVQVEPKGTRENHLDPYLPPRTGVLVVDTGQASSSADLVETIRQLSKGRLHFVVNTSADADHTGGNEAIFKVVAAAAPGGGGGNAPAGPMMFTHENVITRLSAADGPPEAVPTGGFYTDKQVVFNGEPIEIEHVPNAHTDGDSLVFFRRSDVLSTGDLFSTESFPRIDQEKGGSIQGIIAGLNRLLEIAIPGDRVEDGTLVIPGHGRLSDYADVNEYRNMVVIIRDRVQALVQKGQTLEQVKAARLARDYDARYSTPAWTTDMFIEAIYRDLTTK